MIEIIDILGQKNGGDFALVDSNDVKGGYYQVSDLTERDSIPVKRRKIGMLCFVENDKTYQLIDGIENSDWIEFKAGVDEDFLSGELEKKADVDYVEGINDKLTKDIVDIGDYLTDLSGENLKYTTSSDENILTVKDALDKLLYSPLSISLSANKGVMEKGITVFDVVFNWSYNKDIINQRFDGVEIDKALRTHTYDIPFETNKSFALVANDGKSDFSKSLTISFSNGRYWGVSTIKTYDSNFIISLNKELVESKGKTFTVNCGEGQYIYYCFPSRLGTPTFSVGGFSGGFNKIDTIQFTNASGYTESYDIWKSTNSNLGNTTVVVS